MGGERTISAIVDILYGKIAYDPSINHFFHNHNMIKLKE